jgi:hypothetical protein
LQGIHRTLGLEVVVGDDVGDFGFLRDVDDFLFPSCQFIFAI